MATDNNNVQAKAAADAPAKVAETVADTAEKVVKESATAAKRERAKTQRRNARQATAAKTATRRTAGAKRKYTRKAAPKPAAAAQETISTMTNRTFPGFDAIPAFAPFQSMFANVGDRGQDVAQRGQKVAEQFAEATRANVEAMVEAGRVAATGVRTISQDVVATSRDGVEQAANAIRSLAEAKSPTEYMQRQSEIARASFDRMVAESSRLTETMVKLAAEAFQPLSNRASANAERFNNFVA